MHSLFGCPLYSMHLLAFNKLTVTQLKNTFKATKVAIKHVMHLHLVSMYVKYQCTHKVTL